MDPTDAEALAEWLSRDLDDAFAEVVGAFERIVFTTALRVTGQRGDAEDLAAETFLRAYAALRGYPPERIAGLELRPWLMTICLNQWRNQLRTRSRRPLTEGFLGGAVEGAVELHSADEAAEDRGLRLDEGSRLASLLLLLAPARRVAVVLRHVVGLPYAEVADVLGCPESTAKSHVRRGLDQLRDLLSDQDEVLS